MPGDGEKGAITLTENALEATSPKPLWKTFTITIAVVYLITALYAYLSWVIGKDNTAAGYGGFIGFYLIIAAISFWAIKTDKLPRQWLGLDAGKAREAIIIFITGLVIIFSISLPVILTTAENKNIRDYLLNPWNILLFWIMVGITEEFLFRGYVLTRLLHGFQRLSKFRRYGCAIIISSFLFALWHVPVRVFQMTNGIRSDNVWELVIDLLVIFVEGCILCYLFLRTHNILFCGLFHGIGDAPLIISPQALGGKNTSVIFGAVIFIIIVEVTLMIKRRGAAKAPEPHTP